MISPSQRPLPENTQRSQQTDIHDPVGIRTHNLSRRAAATFWVPGAHQEEKKKFSYHVINNPYIFNLCVIDHVNLSRIMRKLAVKLSFWNWSLNIWAYRRQLYTNLKYVRPYACLFYHLFWVEWTEHMSFYLRSICTFSWTCLFTVHHCSRKITSLWHLTPLISLSYVNIWRYLRSCITKSARYLLFCEVQLMFIFWYENTRVGTLIVATK